MPDRMGVVGVRLGGVLRRIRGARVGIPAGLTSLASARLINCSSGPAQPPPATMKTVCLLALPFAATAFLAPASQMATRGRSLQVSDVNLPLSHMTPGH
jgi:hypothetical protein